jgi:hypothetical protein
MEQFISANDTFLTHLIVAALHHETDLQLAVWRMARRSIQRRLRF